MKSTFRSSAGVILLAAASAWPGVAQSQDAAAVRAMAATCANCHGTDGRSVGTVPSLAGAGKGHIVQQMQEFKAGKRPATIMHQLAKGYTDEQIDQLAAYFAAQKK